MTKRKRLRRRESMSLRFPFTKKELKKWTRTLPKKSKIRLVTVTSHDGSKASSFLEAVFWKKVPKPNL